MNEPEWVPRETVLALQERLLAEFGGAAGVRDEGLLESALNRPLNRFGYERPTLLELAADYAFRLVRNHPFFDGNKRIGFVTAVLFLELNGVRFSATEVDATVQTLALAARKISETQYAIWLEANSRKPKRTR
ncbi:MAG TPA: type II toxin-antitoxin system death-on-curing family toxin [Chthoniobacterales bacterium]